MIRRAAHQVLEVACSGCLLLVAVQLPGAAFDYFIRSDVSPAGALMGLVAATAVIAWLVDRTACRPWRMHFRPWAGAAVAAAIAGAFAAAAPAIMRHAFAEVADAGILVPAPGRRDRDCRGQPRRCHDHVFNELGFRGALAHRTAPDAKLVAMIGDSFVFGSGVGDDDTVPAALARELADPGLPVAVVNAGIEGMNGGSFPGVIRYVRTRLNPDLIVVLFKDDDLDDTDMLSRWNLFRRSFWFRVLYVANLEPAIETIRQVWRFWFDRRDRAELATARLDAIANAGSGARLLLMTALADDVRPAVSAWLAAHPDISHLSSWGVSAYGEAERIPHDGHWTENGCRAIAALLAPAVRAAL